MPVALDVCIRCPHSRTAKTPQGAVACDADPARRSITVIADEHDCPLKLFPSEGAGDTLKKIIRATGMEKPGKALRAAVGRLLGKKPAAGGCGGCNKDRKRLNRAWAYKKPG
jgi:hypothetical protein